jgi:hypothetical protein
MFFNALQVYGRKLARRMGWRGVGFGTIRQGLINCGIVCNFVHGGWAVVFLYAMISGWGEYRSPNKY